MKSLKIGGTDLHIKSLKINQLILALGMAFIFCGQAKAADISALDFNGSLLGKVIPDGTVINFENELIGNITADGFVLNDKKELIGGIIPQGIAVSINNSILGKVNNDGSVTGVNDSLIGKVLPTGLIVNNNYDVIGAVVSPGLAYDDKGEIIGRVSGDGRFYNLSGEAVGFVSASGYVYAIAKTDRKITLAGKLISSKMIVSSLGKFLGSIGPDGKVVDLKKNAIGTIRANGFAYNADGDAIGHIVENGYAFNFDGSYLGVISYNGEVTDKGEAVALTTFDGRVINKEGTVIGFSVNLAATVNDLNGKFLGYILPGGSVAKGRTIVGKIGASGNIINDKGQVIGLINSRGPIYDYLGELNANAAVNGAVVSLDGIEIGYMQKDRAFDRKQKEIGLQPGIRLNFDNSNSFIGINGVSSVLNYKSKDYKISPYGYIFDETNELWGRNYKFSEIYAPDGKVLANITSSGRFDRNSSAPQTAKLTASGLAIDANNNLLGKTIKGEYVTDFMGESIGSLNPSNLVVDLKNEIYAKILPDGSVMSLNPKTQINHARMGENAVSVSINGDYLGANMYDGSVKRANEIIGKVSSTKFVVDNMGAIYGKTLPFGAVVDSSCKFLGVVSDNGDARTTKGAYLGMVLANNQVVNEAEEVIGYVIFPQAVNGKSGETIGIQTPLGTVLNYKNQNLGCQDIQQKIRNAQNEIVGSIIPNTTVMDFENNIIGSTDFYGNIIDSAGTNIGYIGVDGGAYSKTGEMIGVIFEYNVAFDDKNIYLGRVNPEGKIITDTKEIIGTVKYDGSVETKDNKKGYALYDLYVYDNEEKTAGYIAQNGRVYSIMGEMKGVSSQGFVLDKKQNLIARGKRDYNILNDRHELIGYLELDGRVVNAKNIEVGSLSENGEILDTNGNVIAIANPLQYYHKIKQETKQPVIEEEQPQTDTPNEQQEKPKESQIVNINISPNEKNNVPEEQDLSETTTVINKAPVDAAGNEIRAENDRPQDQPDEKKTGVSSKWWQNIAGGSTISPWNTGNEPTNVGPGGGSGPGGRYNPRRAAILKQLQDNRRRSLSGKVISNSADTASYTGWQDDWGLNRSVSTLRVDMSNMITADKPIPAVLARSLISLGEAPVTAIVERNIYGDSGRNVIIPAGSRIIGGLQEAKESSRFDNTSGGVKMDINWDRIIRPDGIAFRIQSAQTGDAQGRGGGALGYVDEQLVKKYSLPIFGTMATSAIAYMMATNDDATGEVENSKQQAASDARSNFLEKMDEILDQILESKSQIQAVTFVPAGTRIIIYPMTDLWLRTTKDIENNVGGLRDDRVKDVLIDESAVEEGNSGQKNVQGNNNTANNNNVPANNNQQQGGGVAIPPPAADGSGISVPTEEEEDNGEIDLDF